MRTVVLDENTPCQFCAKPVGFEGKGGETCDRCWYGMRMAPDEWSAELKAEGCAPPTYRGGCIVSFRDGAAGIQCRDPYVPALKVVKP